MGRMKKFERLIKEKCDIPIVSVKAYKPTGLGRPVIEIITEVKFSMGNSVSISLIEDMGVEKTAEIISDTIDE